MSQNDYLETAKALVMNTKNCNLATCSQDAVPELAIIKYYAQEDFTLYFKTFNDSRKYQNITENPKVSITIYSKPDYIQMDGIVEELSGNKSLEVKNNLISKFGLDGYYGDPKVRYLKFIPKWIRLRTKGTYPPEFVSIDV